MCVTFTKATWFSTWYPQVGRHTVTTVFTVELATCTNQETPGYPSLSHSAGDHGWPCSGHRPLWPAVGTQSSPGPVRRRPEISSVGEDVEKSEPSYTADGM